ARERRRRRCTTRGPPPSLSCVGPAGFEPATFCPPDRRANQAAPRPEEVIVPVARTPASALLAMACARPELQADRNPIEIEGPAQAVLEVALIGAVRFVGTPEDHERRRSGGDLRRVVEGAGDTRGGSLALRLLDHLVDLRGRDPRRPPLVEVEQHRWQTVHA